MYTELANKLALGNTDVEYSQAVSMAGGNAASVEVTVFAGEAEITLEVSNDLQNWEPGPALDPTMGAATAGYHFGSINTPSIAAAYVRLKYEATGSTVIAAGINIANL